MLDSIPAHTPEWTIQQRGDPGRTLIELFAWLADTILYRANLIPERQRLAFLRLAGVGMRAPNAATGLVSVFFDEDKPSTSMILRARQTLTAAVPFETTDPGSDNPLSVQGLTVLPVTAQAYA